MASRSGRSAPPDLEALEGRLALSGLGPGVNVISVSTADSRAVTVDYRVDGAPLTGPVAFGVYRAEGPAYQAGDRQVAALTLDPSSTDATGGEHRLTIAVPGGLPPDPAAPYVLAVAGPADGTGAGSTAALRTHVIGVVVHGGIQDGTQTPAWERKLARMLKGVGYDDVIAFNWAAQSNTPGDAAKQGPRLADVVRKASQAFPASDPVDLHLIGHSEGAVVVSQALRGLERETTPQLKAGYLKVTLLDPHAANNHAPGGQFSTGPGVVGAVAKWVIRNYQGRARDPLVVIPPNVDDAEVYYQHTPVGLDKANHGVYNLWGEVPVKGQARYSDLSGPGVAHSGGKGVQVWYAFHVVPTLRDGSNVFVDPTRLTARLVGAAGGVAGTAAPGASVLVFARPDGAGGRGDLALGRTVADAHGDWSVSSPALPGGAYRVFARVAVPEGLPSPRGRLFHAVEAGRVVVAVKAGS